MKQEITLYLDEKAVGRRRTLAAKRETTISKLLPDFLGRAVEKEDFYGAAKMNGLQMLRKAFHLVGVRNWKRRDLYER